MKSPNKNNMEEMSKRFDEKFYQGDSNATYCKAHGVWATPMELKRFVAQELSDQAKEVMEEERNQFSSWIAEGCAETYTLIGLAKFLRNKLVLLGEPNYINNEIK